MQQRLEKQIFIQFDRELYKEQIANSIPSIIKKGKKILKSYIYFNLFFTSLLCLEIIYFFIHITLLVQTFVIAIHLSLIFATLFSFLTLRLYAQSRKTEQLLALISDFLHNCERLPRKGEESDLHLFISDACCKLATEIHGCEYFVFGRPFWCIFLHSSLEKINCYLFWRDIHFIKETLLETSVEKHIQVVRMKPTDLEAHAGLGNAYVMLSGIYVDPASMDGLEDGKWIPSNKFGESFKQKFRLCAKKAIEEFKILSHYAPNDPWVHAQLAYSYRDLQMPAEEMKEYETILTLCPEDKESLFQLGKLYFAQGKNGKGLQIYETLTSSNYKKAEQLIRFYDGGKVLEEV